MEENTENVYELNDIRRIRNMEKAVKIFERQLADLKKATLLLAEHADFRFFSIACHEMVAEQKKIASELLKLRIRLQKYKDKYENKETVDE